MEFFQPLADCPCSKFRSVVGSEMGRRTFLEKLLSEYFNHILSLELPSDPQHQAFPAVFIDQGQDPQRTAIVSSVSHKVIRPDMVFEEGPQPDAGSVIEPEPAAFRLFGRDFQPFLLPDPLNSLVIDMPAFTSQKLLNPSVSITSVPAGEFNGSLSQFFVEFTLPGLITLCSPVL